ncbi:MAG: PAC2 family protein [Microthrixaceae bacterium]
MGNLSWDDRPPAAVTGSTRSVLVAAFDGWNDGGEAASRTMAVLWDQWLAHRIAHIPAGDFADFTMTRPTMEVVDGVPKSISWPDSELGWTTPTPELSVVLLRGPEPEFRWDSYCDEVLDAADELGASTLVTLGAILSDVPHTRPAPVFCTAHEAHILDAVGLPRSNYEGSVGIPSVLAQRAHERGIEALGLWAAVPAYASHVPSAKGTLALLDVLERILAVDLDTSGFTDAVEGYSTYLDEVVAEDHETAAYVNQLEAAYDEADQMALGSSTDIAVEVEKYLRDL